MLPNVQRTDAADHVPVLAEEVRELLDVQPGETVVDATFGAGGHSRILAGELQEWGYQAVTDVETLGTFVDGTASTTAIVLRGHDANSRPLIINLIVQVEGGAIVSFR